MILGLILGVGCEEVSDLPPEPMAGEPSGSMIEPLDVIGMATDVRMRILATELIRNLQVQITSV